ncbi:MAG: hypothetical protein IKC87_00920 [Clostridia bacterium]|nr:hypothetical protein [Clostridia bacterium]
MGFGTLFFGYFLLLDVLYYHFTDIIAALVMLYALYRISSVSGYFKAPTFASIGFAVFALGELVLGVLDLFEIGDLGAVITYVSMARYVILAVFTAFLLRAIYGIATELDVEGLPMKCKTMTVSSMLVYLLLLLLSTPMLTNLLLPAVNAVLYLVALIGNIVILISNLTIIYTCYMRICMPEDLKEKEEKPSRFEFINEFRRRRKEREAERAEKEKRRLEEKKKGRTKR